ncbi:MAG: phosphate acetyltransferase [Tessaracoccus sp.]
MAIALTQPAIYLCSTQRNAHLSQLTVAVVAAMTEKYSRVGIFRPVENEEEFLRDPAAALSAVIARYARCAEEHDAVVIVGGSYNGSLAPIEFSWHARIAANIEVPLTLLVPGDGNADLVTRRAEVALAEAQRHFARVIGAFAVKPSGSALTSSDFAGFPVPFTVVDCEIDVATLLDKDNAVGRDDIVTPLLFEHRLLERARAARRHIVLPEGEEERILRASHRILENQICRLTLLGRPDVIKDKAAQLGVEISRAGIVDPQTSELRERFAVRYAELRAKKGVTLAQARDRLRDVSYFGTMMVAEGLADGMVSGCVNTTAHTIRPSLEVIKTKPGVSVVSSAFLMCLADRVLVFGDCAVNPNPTPEQVADIAISSAETARQFDVEPRVAMLSYSTGTSGSGPDVDQTIEATRLVKERAPELAVDGPLQYDAAVEPSVARTKLPDSPVAGRATVLIFPDLQTGNNTYKAVQRSAGALAVGPVLQGLNKPVNDLSRGALVADIINTVAITAIQAGRN